MLLLNCFFIILGLQRYKLIENQQFFMQQYSADFLDKFLVSQFRQNIKTKLLSIRKSQLLIRCVQKNEFVKYSTSQQSNP